MDLSATPLDTANTEMADATELAEKLTMVGWLAKGLLFVVIGFLGLRIARRGYSSDDADQAGALSTIVDAPLGRPLVLFVSVGLILFAVWHVWSAFTRDIEWAHIAESASVFLDVCRSVGEIGLSVVYSLLAITGIQAALTGSADGSSESGATSPEGVSSFLLALPAGSVVVAAVGVVTIAVGLYHLHKGITRDFLDDIRTEGLSEVQTTSLAVLGITGFVARSAMLGIVGALFLVAAWQHDADEAAGLDQALRTVTELGVGRIGLGVAAAGLVAAGIYDMITFRRQQLAD